MKRSVSSLHMDTPSCWQVPAGPYPMPSRLRRGTSQQDILVPWAYSVDGSQENASQPTKSLNMGQSPAQDINDESSQAPIPSSQPSVPGEMGTSPSPKSSLAGDISSMIDAGQLEDSACFDIASNEQISSQNADQSWQTATASGKAKLDELLCSVQPGTTTKVSITTTFEITAPP